MSRSDEREELKSAIRLSHARYASEFSDISEEQRDLKFPGFHQTPAENLSRRTGWMTTMLLWERSERIGVAPQIPPEYALRRDGSMNRMFEERYADTTLEMMLGELGNDVFLMCTVIDTMSDDELFEPHGRMWAESAVRNGTWPAARFFHANAVGGFDTARSRIRRWKRLRDSASADPALKGV